MPTDEPVNRFVIDESKVRSSLRPEAPANSYQQQNSSHLIAGKKFKETRKMVVNKMT